MESTHSVTVAWGMPATRKHYKIQPLDYLTHLIGHEGRGSILSYLKKKYVRHCKYSRHEKSWAFGVGVFSDYLENGKQSMLQPIHFRKDLSRDLSKNVWVAASIVYQFRDNRQKHQHRRLNSYRGYYTTTFGDLCRSRGASYDFWAMETFDQHAKIYQNAHFHKNWQRAISP